MVRSVGIAALVVSLAWTGLAGAQSSSPQATAAARPRYMIVNEDGERPQRCQVVKTWRDASGAAAFQVRAVDSGEMITIVASSPSGAGGDPREMSTRIYRWGAENKPPADAPVAPPTAVTMPTPPPTQAAPVLTQRPVPAANPAPLPPSVTAQAAPLMPPAPNLPTRPASQPVWVTPYPPTSTVRTAPAVPTPARSMPVVPPQPTSTVLTAPQVQPSLTPAKPVVLPQSLHAASADLSLPPLPQRAAVQAVKPAQPTPLQTRSVDTLQPISSAAKPDQPFRTQAPQVVTPRPLGLPAQPLAPATQPSTMPRVVTSSQPSSTPQILSKPSSTTAAVATPPASMDPKIINNSSATSSKPALAALVSKPQPVAPRQPVSVTPMGTQVVQYTTMPVPQSNVSSTTLPSQPRLSPMAGGATTAAKANCGCPSPCTTCTQPCTTCNSSPCVNCTPPLRQGFMSRLFKSNSPSPCKEVACQPALPAASKPVAVTVAPSAPMTKVALDSVEPAKPRDWRESWGKVEPWKETAQASTAKPEATLVARRVDPAPVHYDPPKELDPIKAPDQYRDLAMEKRLNSSKIPAEEHVVEVRKPKTRLFPTKWSKEPMSPTRPVPVSEAMMANAPPSTQWPSALTTTAHQGSEAQAVAANAPMPANGMVPPASGSTEQAVPPATQQHGRAIQLAANEPNAFWSPPEQPKPEAAQPEQPKVNAFERGEDNQAPQGIPPTIRGLTQMPRGTMAVTLPPPPRGPIPSLPQGPSMPPTRPDMGIADAMGNAFTVPGTRRPIPADFGGTPQEPNGFDPMVQMGQGSPPQGYTMAGPGMPRPPMPNRMAMGPMAGNPFMNVPPTVPHPAFAAAPIPATAAAAGAPQMLTTLKDSLYPSERETAAEQLSEMDWRDQPQVVEGLMKAAKEDPAATVRAACVHALAHMRVDTAGALALVRDLKADRDPRVRHEAEEALGELGESGIQQASHK